MSFAQDYKDLADHFRAAWGETGYLTFDNAPDNARPVNAISYHFAIRLEDEIRESFGSINARYTRTGTVFLEISVPGGDGTLVGYEKADAFAAIFRNYRTATLRCATPEINSADFDAGLWIIRVAVPFEIDRTF